MHYTFKITYFFRKGWKETVKGAWMYKENWIQFGGQALFIPMKVAKRHVNP